MKIIEGFVDQYFSKIIAKRANQTGACNLQVADLYNIRAAGRGKFDRMLKLPEVYWQIVNNKHSTCSDRCVDGFDFENVNMDFIKQ